MDPESPTATLQDALLAPIQSNEDTLEAMSKDQNEAIKSLQDIPQQIGILTQFSKKRYEETQSDFARQVQILSSIHTEMGLIMKHIRSIQSKLQSRNPAAYARAEALFPPPVDLCDDP